MWANTRTVRVRRHVQCALLANTRPSPIPVDVWTVSMGSTRTTTAKAAASPVVQQPCLGWYTVVGDNATTCNPTASALWAHFVSTRPVCIAPPASTRTPPTRLVVLATACVPLVSMATPVPRRWQARPVCRVRWASSLHRTAPRARRVRWGPTLPRMACRACSALRVSTAAWRGLRRAPCVQRASTSH